MSEQAPSDFWEWSLRYYSLKGVATNLLRLQDDFGLNVNLMLWCLWCAETYEQIPDLIMRKAIDLTSSWSSSLAQDLRRVRKNLKTPPRQVDPKKARILREYVKKAELDAEEIEQTMLNTLAVDALKPDGSDAVEERARRNLACYATLIDVGSKSGFSVSFLENLIEATHDKMRPTLMNTDD